MNAPLEIRSDAHFVGFVHSDRAVSARLCALRFRLAVSLGGANREAIGSPTFVLARRGASGWRVCSVRSVDGTSVELWTVGRFDSDSPRIELSCATVRRDEDGDGFPEAHRTWMRTSTGSAQGKSARADESVVEEPR
jgi:hypothetical protein